MGGADNPAQKGPGGPRLNRQVPGNWYDNPLTCRILRNSGYVLDDGARSASGSPPIRTVFDVIGQTKPICNGDKPADTRNRAGKERK